jgi:hypothetical protein
VPTFGLSYVAVKLIYTLPKSPDNTPDKVYFAVAEFVQSYDF